MRFSNAFRERGFSSIRRQDRRAKAFHPVVQDALESRTMPSLPVPSLAPDPRVPADASLQYYPQAIPISDPSGIVFTNPTWEGALAYQYGPSPDQQLWVFVPPDPNGRLDLLVHGGGFRRGAPIFPGIDGFAQLDLDQGTTLISIGYRKLDTSAWPTPVEDIAVGIDDGYQIAQNLTGNRITDITETGVSAGGTAVALINYSAKYPTTMVRPNRIITISAPFETNAAAPAQPVHGFRRPSLVWWNGVIPKARIPITLMGTPGDPVATESHQFSTIQVLASDLRRHGVSVATYFDPHGHGRHGSVASDFLVDPDVKAALQEAYSSNGS
jgi:acetyl esterase/lipase